MRDVYRIYHQDLNYFNAFVDRLRQEGIHRKVMRGCEYDFCTAWYGDLIIGFSTYCQHALVSRGLNGSVTVTKKNKPWKAGKIILPIPTDEFQIKFLIKNIMNYNSLRKKVTKYDLRMYGLK